MPDGLIVKPKQSKEYWHQYYLAHKAERMEKKRLWRLANKEKHQAAKKRWRERHPEQAKEAAQRGYQHGQKRAIAYARTYTRDNPVVIQAHNAVMRAIHRTKVLTRPDHCAECGKRCKPQGHHWKGYAPEHWLEIIWLCVTCHRAAHA